MSLESLCQFVALFLPLSQWILSVLGENYDPSELPLFARFYPNLGFLQDGSK